MDTSWIKPGAAAVWKAYCVHPTPCRVTKTRRESSVVEWSSAFGVRYVAVAKNRLLRRPTPAELNQIDKLIPLEKPA